MPTTERRRYPWPCLSMNCGETRDTPTCQACPDRPALDAFEAWRKRTGAQQVDPIWCRTLYEAPATNEAQP